MADSVFTVSVDVEDFFSPRPPTDMYRARLDSGEWGALKIADLCEKSGVQATFFVDVVNVDGHVDQAMIRDLCQELDRRGHEVALHTHPPRLPHHAGAINDRVLLNYGFEEQYSFIMTGAERILTWTGKWPRTHRAGSYGANAQTFKALERAGILRDSSVFWGRKQFDFIADANSGRTFSFRIGEVNEFPVTSFFTSTMLGLIRARKKFDLNWLGRDEALAFIANTRYKRVDYFLHSYSLLDCRTWQPSAYFTLAFEQGLAALLRRFIPKRFDELSPALASVGELDSEEKHHLRLSDYAQDDWENIYLSKIALRLGRVGMTKY